MAFQIYFSNNNITYKLTKQAIIMVLDYGEDMLKKSGVFLGKKIDIKAPLLFLEEKAFSIIYLNMWQNIL